MLFWLDSWTFYKCALFGLQIEDHLRIHFYSNDCKTTLTSIWSKIELKEAIKEEPS